MKRSKQLKIKSNQLRKKLLEERKKIIVHGKTKTTTTTTKRSKSGRVNITALIQMFREKNSKSDEDK